MKNKVMDAIVRIILAVIMGVFAFLMFSVFMKNLGHENYFQNAFIWSVAWCVGTFVGSTILEEIYSSFWSFFLFVKFYIYILLTK